MPIYAIGGHTHFLELLYFQFFKKRDLWKEEMNIYVLNPFLRGTVLWCLLRIWDDKRPLY